MGTAVEVIAGIDIVDKEGETVPTFLFTADKNHMYRITASIVLGQPTESAHISANLTTEFTEVAIISLHGIKRDIGQTLVISPIDGDVYAWANSEDYTQFTKYRLRVLVEEIKT